jgi:hypothetical protein
MCEKVFRSCDYQTKDFDMSSAVLKIAAYDVCDVDVCDVIDISEFWEWIDVSRLTMHHAAASFHFGNLITLYTQ